MRISHRAKREFLRYALAEGIGEAVGITTDKDDFADSLAGATALKITREMMLSELAEVAEEALTRFRSDAYKQTGFQIIDKVQPILDQILLGKLDEEAVKIIKSGQDNFELSMPGWSEEDIVHYGFSGLRVQERFPDLLMQNYRAELGSDAARIEGHGLREMLLHVIPIMVAWIEMGFVRI